MLISAIFGHRKTTTFPVDARLGEFAGNVHNDLTDGEIYGWVLYAGF